MPDPYVLICSTSDIRVAEEVNKKLEEGYIFAGPLMTGGAGDSMYFYMIQPMILPEYEHTLRNIPQRETNNYRKVTVPNA